ncbi:MAG: hypothetical protein Q4B43_08975 [Bacteroidota bacterium]|nr:hypothetical protein [Bacteroidota bacterium]
MTSEEKEKILKQKEQDLLYYLRNYNELTRIRPEFKKVALIGIFLYSETLKVIFKPFNQLRIIFQPICYIT